jgi:hypothetical protein
MLSQYLEDDSSPRAERLLRTCPELTGEVCAGLLRDAEAAAAGSVAAPAPRQHRAFLARCRPDGLDAVFPAGSPDIDPNVTGRLRPAMARADEAEAAFDDTGDVASLLTAVAVWRRILGQHELSDAYPALRAALSNRSGAAFRTALQRVDVLERQAASVRDEL